MNMRTLAKLCGVSVSAVSKAFSGSKEISESTRQHIFAVARENGCFDLYNKNKIPKKVIAVITPETGSEYYTTLLEHLEREIEARDALMMVSVSHFSADRVRELFAYYTDYIRVDGIVLTDHGYVPTNPRKTPTVALTVKSVGEHMTPIWVHLDRGIEEAMAYLKQNGHTEVGFAGEMLTQSKMESCKRAMRHLGLPVREGYFHVSRQRFEEAGIEAVEALLATGEPLPTAIVAAYDYIAIGVIRALRQYGYRVPEDVSVIGMDDIRLASYPETSLSTVHTRFECICREAVEVLMRKIENRHWQPRNTLVVDSEFIPRASSGPRKAREPESDRAK